MNWRRVALVARHELSMVAGDLSTTVVLIGMPLILIVFAKNGMKNGVAQAVPGIATLFSFFIVGFLGFAFFRDHGWGTWERLRVSGIEITSLVVGKALPFILLGFAQLIFLFTIGWAALGLPLTGSPLALALVALTTSICTVSMGLLLVAITPSIQRLSIISNLSAVVLGGVGGAFSPSSSFGPAAG